MVDAGALQYSNQSKLLALSKETAKKASWMDARAWKTQVTTLITYAVMSNRVAILPEIACIEYALPPLILLPEMNCLPFPRHCREAACIGVAPTSNRQVLYCCDPSTRQDTIDIAYAHTLRSRCVERDALRPERSVCRGVVVQLPGARLEGGGGGARRGQAGEVPVPLQPRRTARRGQPAAPTRVQPQLPAQRRHLSRARLPTAVRGALPEDVCLSGLCSCGVPIVGCLLVPPPSMA